eukprot:gene1911-2255_t
MEADINFGHEIQFMDLKEEFLILATDVLSTDVKPSDPVGVVTLVNMRDNSRLHCKRSDDLPFTHPMPIRSVCSTINDGVFYMITAGGEGLIRTWRLNGVTGTFEHLALLEGHTRGVTTLLLIGTALWSGSMDRSIRCWDVGSGTCRGILTSANGGHKEPVTCMEVITMDDASTYVVSGGADAELIIWDMLGNKSWGGSQGGMVTCLRASQDTVGSRILLVGLSDGRVLVRSLQSMQLLTKLPAHRDAVWSIVNCGLGSGYFAT